METYLKKIIKENYPNLVKEIDMQIQEAQRVPNKMGTKTTTPRHTIIKMPTVKDRESCEQQQKSRELPSKGFP